MEYLFLPMLTIAKTMAEPSDDWAPYDSLERSPLEEMIAIREQYKCAITGMDDVIYVRRLAEQGLPTPARHYCLMTTAYIIPFPLDKFIENSAALVRLFNFPASLSYPPKQIDPTHMRDMLISWTNLDVEKLTGPNLNSPANAILMTLTEHSMFGNFQIYFDKEAYPTTPNKYAVRMATRFYQLSDGLTSADVEFHMRDGVQPPDPEYLAVHAAIAKVVNACGVTDYVEDLDSEEDVPLGDASTFMSRLAIREP
ncbi:hypothetical protein BD779DRAFT_1124475 [Infundibulicybe gibba]|nr:hypothetical protein BD779DRAFT_1124475 [Infundibulicybe gibba]